MLVQSGRSTREQATTLVREAEVYAATATGEVLERLRQTERYFTANTTAQLRNSPGNVIGAANLLPVNGNWLDKKGGRGSFPDQTGIRKPPKRSVGFTKEKRIRAT